jgi:hypothetical protein
MIDAVFWENVDRQRLGPTTTIEPDADETTETTDELLHFVCCRRDTVSFCGDRATGTMIEVGAGTVVDRPICAVCVDLVPGRQVHPVCGQRGWCLVMQRHCVGRPD